MTKKLVLLLLAGTLSATLAGCQTDGNYMGLGSAPSTAQPAMPTTPGSQTVTIAASPKTVHDVLIASAKQHGTLIVQDNPNMIVMERLMSGNDPAVNKEFGPSDHGARVVRIRIRLMGSGCQTTAVQDLALVNNANTTNEQSFAMPGNDNTMQSLRGLQENAERHATCTGSGPAPASGSGSF